MSREEFIKQLDAKSYRWREEGEWIIVSEEQGVVSLNLKSIPDNVQFNNGSTVRLDFMESMGNNVNFNNRGNVYLDSLKTMGNSVQFNNSQCHVHLGSLKSIGDNVQFTNGGNVHLNSLESIPDNIRFRNRSFVLLHLLKSIPINLDSEEIFQNSYEIKIGEKWLNLEKNIVFPDSRWNKTN